MDRVRAEHTPEDGLSCSFLGVMIELDDPDEPSFVVVSRAAGAYSSDPFEMPWSTLGHTESFVMLGGQGCATGWEDVDFGDETTIRIGRMDAAGNFSGWSDERDVRAPRRSACSVVANPGAPASWLAVLLALGVPRRRPAPGQSLTVLASIHAHP